MVNLKDLKLAAAANKSLEIERVPVVTVLLLIDYSSNYHLAFKPTLGTRQS